VELIRPLRDALGDEPAIVVDSGIRHGADIAIAVARGADLAGIGRAYLYGLAAGGRRGATLAIDLLLSQLKRTFQLLGVSSLAELRGHGDQFSRNQGELAGELLVEPYA
jgi:isopentenyl diphosphate isomerase/L-lactate dehydrogenase-like FMN-dependent dehydrogenase